MFSSAFVAVKLVSSLKSLIMIPLALGLCIYGITSCNSLLSTYKNAGAMEIERQVLQQAQENAAKRMEQQTQVANLHEQTSKAYYEELQSLEDQHKEAVDALHARLAANESKDTNICPVGCLVP